MDPENAVFEGKSIFQIYFEGTKYKAYRGYSGPDDFQGLNPRNFGHWIHLFERCVADLFQSNMNNRPVIERWWDSIKKVIRLH
jgi:hypothetical protein